MIQEIDLDKTFALHCASDEKRRGGHGLVHDGSIANYGEVGGGVFISAKLRKVNEAKKHSIQGSRKRLPEDYFFDQRASRAVLSMRFMV